MKGLASKPNVDITIIDSRDYFEYTPGILRAFVQPDHIHKLTADLKRLEELGHNVTFLHAEVKSIHDGELLVSSCKVKSDTETRVPFDYLVIATGSRYPSCEVVKPTTQEATLDSRIPGLQNVHRAIKAAHSILIIGGGPVGVELAAELLTHFPNKHVKIVDMQSKVCASLSDKATEYITRWLLNRNCDLILGKGIAGTWPNLLIDSGGCLSFTCACTCCYFANFQHSSRLQHSSRPCCLATCRLQPRRRHPHQRRLSTIMHGNATQHTGHDTGRPQLHRIRNRPATRPQGGPGRHGPPASGRPSQHLRSGRLHGAQTNQRA